MLYSSWDPVWTKYLVHSLLYLMDQLHFLSKLEDMEWSTSFEIKHGVHKKKYYALSPYKLERTSSQNHNWQSYIFCVCVCFFISYHI